MKEEEEECEGRVVLAARMQQTNTVITMSSRCVGRASVVCSSPPASHKPAFNQRLFVIGGKVSRPARWGVSTRGGNQGAEPV